MPALRDERTKVVDSRSPALPAKESSLHEVSAPQAHRSREENRSAIQDRSLVSTPANSLTISDASIAASLESLAQQQEQFTQKVLTPAQSLKTGAERNLASSEKQLAECGFAGWVVGLTAACEQGVAVSQKDLANKTAHAEKLNKVYESSLETKRAAEEMLLTAKRAEAQGFTNEAAAMRKGATDLLRQASDALKGHKSLDAKQAAETIAGLQKVNQKLETAVNRAEWGVTIAGGVKETAHTVGVGVGFALGGPAGGAAVNQGLRMVEGAAEESMRAALGEKSWKDAGASFLARSQDALVESAITGVSGAAGQKIGAVVQKLKGPTIAKVVDIVSSGTVQSAGTGVQIGYEYAKAHNEFQKEHGKLTGPERDGAYAKFMTERGFSLEEVSKKLGISFVAGAGAKGAFHGVEKLVSTGALQRAKGVVADRVEDLTNNGVEIAGSGQPITVQTIIPALLGGHLTQRAVSHAGPHGGVARSNAAPSSQDGPHAPVVTKQKDEVTQVSSRSALAANATHEVNLNGVKGSIRVSGEGNAEYVSNRALLQERYAEQRTREIVSSDSSKTDMEARSIARQEALGVVAYYDKENKRVVIPEFKDMPKAEKQKIISFIHHEVLGHGRGGDEFTAYRVQADKANQLGLELRLSDGRVSLRQPSPNEPLHRTTDAEIRQHIAKNYTPGQLESRVVAAGMERAPELKINGEELIAEALRSPSARERILDGLNKQRKTFQADNPEHAHALGQVVEALLVVPDFRDRLSKPRMGDSRDLLEASIQRRLEDLKSPFNVSAVARAAEENLATIALTQVKRLAIPDTKAGKLQIRIKDQNQEIASDLCSGRLDVDNAFRFPHGYEKKKILGPELITSNTEIRSALGVEDTSILAGPDGTIVSFRTLLETCSRHGYDTAALFERYNIGRSDGILQPHQARIKVVVGDDGHVLCPFGCRPVATVSEGEAPLTVTRCVTGEVRVQAPAGTELDLIFEKRPWGGDVDAAAKLLSEILPAQDVALPKYLETIHPLLAEALPADIKGRLLLQGVRHSMIYSLDPRLETHLEELGADSIKWSTEAGVGWCVPQSAIIANLLNLQGIPAWIIQGQCPDTNTPQYVRSPGHATVALILNGAVMTFDPTLQAIQRPILSWDNASRNAGEIIEHARSVRADSLELPPEAKSARQDGHNLKDDFHDLSDAVEDWRALRSRIWEINQKLKSNEATAVSDALECIASSFDSTPSPQRLKEMRRQLIGSGYDVPKMEEVHQSITKWLAELDYSDLSPPSLMHAAKICARLSTDTGHNAFAAIPQFCQHLNKLPKGDVIEVLPSLLSYTEGSQNDLRGARNTAFDVLDRVLSTTELSDKEWQQLRHSCVYYGIHRTLQAIREPEISRARDGFQLDRALTDFEGDLIGDPSRQLALCSEAFKDLDRMSARYPKLRPLPEDMFLAVTFTDPRSRVLFGRAAEGTSFAGIFDEHGKLTNVGKASAERFINDALHEGRFPALARSIVRDLGVKPNEGMIQGAIDQFRNQFEASLSGEAQGFSEPNYNTRIMLEEIYEYEQRGSELNRGSETLQRYRLIKECRPDVAQIVTQADAFKDFLQKTQRTSVESLVSTKDKFGITVEPRLIREPNVGLVERLAAHELGKEDPRKWISSLLEANRVDWSLSEQKRLRQKEEWEQGLSIIPNFAQAVDSILTDRSLDSLTVRTLMDTTYLGASRNDRKLAGWLESAPEALPFRDRFGNYLSEMREKVQSICTSEGYESAIAEISRVASNLPFKAEDIFITACYSTAAEPLTPSRAMKSVPLRSLLAEALTGSLQVQEIQWKQQHNRQNGERSLRRSPRGSVDPYEYNWIEVKPGEPLPGRIDWKASARSDKIIARVDVRTSAELAKTPRSVVVHPEWLIETQGLNSVARPERLLSLIKSLDEARREGRPMTVALWDGIRTTNFTAHSKQAIVDCAESLYAAACGYARNRAFMRMTQFCVPQKLPVVAEPGKGVVFLCGKDEMTQERLRLLAAKIPNISKAEFR